MKKLILSVTIATASACAFAQQPTMDFESWTGAGTGIEPTGWVSENAAIFPIPPYSNNPQSLFQATSPNVNSGTYAMKIISVTMAAPISGLPNPIGLAATGIVVTSPAPKILFGFPFTGRPNSISFYEKDSLVSGDMAEFFTCLTKWNVNKRDTLAYGIWQTGANVSTYTLQNVALTYTTAIELPDTMTLIFSSTKLFNADNTLCLTCGTAGSILWVDDISFDGWNSVNETEMSKGLSVFPNPATDRATITVENVNDAAAVEVFDITGRSVITLPFTQSPNGINKKSALISTQELSAGLYSLSVYDKDKHILRSGKLNVVK